MYMLRIASYIVKNHTNTNTKICCDGLYRFVLKMFLQNASSVDIRKKNNHHK